MALTLKFLIPKIKPEMNFVWVLGIETIDVYEVTWDREKKKQVWNYRGKVARDFNAEKFKDELYLAIRKDYRIRIPKKER